MKVMVNGATGLVGLSTIKAYIEDGWDVRASDLPGADYRELEKLGVEIVPASLDDQASLEKAVGCVDAVVHVAGLFDLAAPAEKLEAINHQGTRNICEAVLKKAPNLERFVQVSTVGVYGKPARCPCREDHPKRPRNNYEKTKWKGEMAAFEYHRKEGLPVAALRPTLIYGPNARYGHAMFIAALCLYKINVSNVLYGLRSGPLTSHVHVDDVGRAAAILGKNPKAVGRSFNIADPNPVDGLSFTKALTDPLGIELKETIPLYPPLMSLVSSLVGLMPSMPIDMLNRRISENWKTVQDEKGLAPALGLRLDRDWIGYMTGDNFYDVSAIRELGMEWKYPDAVEGIRSTIEWYRENEWIP